MAVLLVGGPLWAAEPVVRTQGAYPVRVLFIGDSLSVGPFGKEVEASLRRRYGAKGYCLFASCGSSPEDWLRGTPVFTTKCGYRQSTPAGTVAHEYSGGRRPAPVKTPKLPMILARFRPEVVIVQLGTNWFGKIAPGHTNGAVYRGVIKDFVRGLRSVPGPPPRIIWVMPPSSSAYPAETHEDVERWITESSRALDFRVVNSRRITGPYRKGTTGSDGVHYSGSAGRAWARGVLGVLSAAP
jgi:hypothetical protein